MEMLARRQVIEQVREHVRKALPDCVLEVFGSERTGISLATSDIDLRLRMREDLARQESDLPPPASDREKLIGVLTKLHKHLARQPAYIQPVIRHAHYPLISMRDCASGIDIQIVLSNDTSRSREMMHQYMHRYPYLHQTYTLVKTMFQCRGLADVYRGGFGSYSIFMMLVAALRHKPPQRPTAVDALYCFLLFWHRFDTTKHGISIEPRKFIKKEANLVMTNTTKQKIEVSNKKKKISPTHPFPMLPSPPQRTNADKHTLQNKSIESLPPYMLCLRDPANKTNDLGRKGRAIKHVLTTLGAVLASLNRQMHKNDANVSFLLDMVGPIHDVQRKRREKLENRGLEIYADLKGSLETRQQDREDTEQKIAVEETKREITLDTERKVPAESTEQEIPVEEAEKETMVEEAERHVAAAEDTEQITKIGRAHV